ncbi:MAG: T9SS type A sorting domain-containing protein [Weeksellaceae bacterium]|nr:T9SS type A sorting domain-containing protein [Weeksellaceae bacterium]
MNKILQISCLAVLGTATLFGQDYKAPNMAFQDSSFNYVAFSNEDLPTTQWADSAETDWYNGSEDTFTLSTPQQLAGLSLLVAQGNSMVGKTIELSGDIQLSGNLWTPIGVNNNNPFSGVFNGNNFTVHNMVVNRPGEDFLGLFGQTNAATIRNVRMTNAIVQGADTAGTVVGNLYNDGLLENCHSTGHSVLITGYNAGGMLGGALTNSVVNRCSAEGSVVGVNQIGGFVGTLWDKTEVHESYSAGTVSGEYIIGGFAGFSTMAFGPDRENKVFNSYSRSNVFATMFRAGGFFGSPEYMSEIHNCYSTGTVSQVEDAGAFVGSTETALIENSYYDSDLNSFPAIGNQEAGASPFDVTGLPTAEMTTANFADMLNVDTENIVWFYHPEVNDGYPNLNLQEQMSVSDVAVASKIGIYPSIVQDQFIIKAENDGLKYQIFDVNGKLVRHGITHSTEHVVHAHGLATGVYFVRVIQDNHAQSIKIIKK